MTGWPQHRFLKLCHRTATITAHEQPSSEQEQSPYLVGTLAREILRDREGGRSVGRGVQWQNRGALTEERRAQIGGPGENFQTQEGLQGAKPWDGHLLGGSKDSKRTGWLARTGLGDVLKGRAGIQTDGAPQSHCKDFGINSECHGKSRDDIKYFSLFFKTNQHCLTLFTIGSKNIVKIVIAVSPPLERSEQKRRKSCSPPIAGSLSLWPLTGGEQTAVRAGPGVSTKDKTMVEANRRDKEVADSQTYRKAEDNRICRDEIWCSFQSRILFLSGYGEASTPGDTCHWRTVGSLELTVPKGEGTTVELARGLGARGWGGCSEEATRGRLTIGHKGTGEKVSRNLYYDLGREGTGKAG